MGYKRAVNWTSTGVLRYDGVAQLEIVLSDIECGDQTDISDCRMRTHDVNCNHDEDVYLECTNQDTTDQLGMSGVDIQSHNIICDCILGCAKLI